MKKIKSLSFFKFIAMLLIVWLHIGFPTGKIDWGARMCEFLFVASGFLVGYNYYKKGMEDSYKYSSSYTYKKIRKFYPLHIISLIALMLVGFRVYIANFELNQLPLLISNILLLQAWSPDVGGVAFSYNGVSWFLSALIFCYFISPLLIKCIKSKKTSIIMFVLVAFVRFSLEFWNVGGSLFSLAVHTSPIIRCLEYFMGMLMVPVFFYLQEKMVDSADKVGFKVIWTILEILLIASVIGLMYEFNATWIRFYFVLMFCVFTFLFAFDLGWVSNSTSAFNKLSAIQLEVYLLQLPIARLVYKVIDKLNWAISANLALTIALVFIFLFAYLYKKFLEEKLAILMDKIVNGVKKILF